MSAPASSEASPHGLTGPMLVIAGALAIGFAPIGLRLSEFGPQSTALWRYVFALPLLALLAIRAGGIGRPSWAALCAGVLFGLDMAFWHAGLKQTSVANATFIVNLGAVLAGLAAWVLLRQTPGRTWPFAVALALSGAWALSRGAVDKGDAALVGDLLALAAALFVGLYLVVSIIARQRDRAMSVLFWATCSSIAVALPASLVMGEQIVPPDLTWFAAPAALGVIAHVLGQGLIMAGLGRTPASVAGLLLLIQPVAAALIAWQAFGEALAPVQLGGCALILAGVWLAGRK